MAGREHSCVNIEETCHKAGRKLRSDNTTQSAIMAWKVISQSMQGVQRFVWITLHFVRVIFWLYEPEPTSKCNKARQRLRQLLLLWKQSSTSSQDDKVWAAGSSSTRWDWAVKYYSGCICATVAQQCQETLRPLSLLQWDLELTVFVGARLSCQCRGSAGDKKQAKATQSART